MLLFTEVPTVIAIDDDDRVGGDRGIQGVVEMIQNPAHLRVHIRDTSHVSVDQMTGLGDVWEAIDIAITREFLERRAGEVRAVDRCIPGASVSA